MTFGRVNASDRKIVSGCSRLISRERPLPEPERLGVRVVDPEDRDAVADPERDDVLQLAPERLPVVGFEVDRVDVLVLLRRVLGVLDRAVRAMAEPLRDARAPTDDRATPGRRCRARSRGRAVARRRRSDRSRRACRAPARSPCGRPLAAPIAQGLPGSSGAGVSALLRPLAEAAADRVDRRQVQHVEAHRRRRRAAAPRLRRTSRCRAGSVPAERGNISYQAPKRARSRSTMHVEHAVVPRGAAPIGVRAPSARAGRRVERRGDARRRAGARVARSRPRFAQPAPPAPAARERPSRERARRLRAARSRRPGPPPTFLAELLPPGGEAVDPAFNRVLVAPDGLDDEAGLPAIVAERRPSALRATGSSPAAAIQEDRRQLVVPVREDVGRDRDPLARDPLDREPPGIDLRRTFSTTTRRASCGSSAACFRRTAALGALEVDARLLME